MCVTVQKPLSLADFLAWEERQELRYEFDGFAPVAMTGGTIAHGQITFDLRTALATRLTGKPCRPLGPNTKVIADGRARYPDALIVCQPVSPTATVVGDPVILFEVLSEGSSQTDLIDKNRDYRATPSIQRYVVLQQTDTATEVFCIGPDHSAAWCAIYQTRYGAFFKVVVDHDGETVLEFKPLTDDEALTEVQHRKPQVVSQFFGDFPEAGAAERRLTIRLPGNLALRLESAAQAKRLSLNSYAMRCFEQCAAADGYPAWRESCAFAGGCSWWLWATTSALNLQSWRRRRKPLQHLARLHPGYNAAELETGKYQTSHRRDLLFTAQTRIRALDEALPQEPSQHSARVE